MTSAPSGFPAGPSLGGRRAVGSLGGVRRDRRGPGGRRRGCHPRCQGRRGFRGLRRSAGRLSGRRIRPRRGSSPAARLASRSGQAAPGGQRRSNGPKRALQIVQETRPDTRKRHSRPRPIVGGEAGRSGLGRAGCGPADSQVGDEEQCRQDDGHQGQPGREDGGERGSCEPRSAKGQFHLSGVAAVGFSWRWTRRRISSSSSPSSSARRILKDFADIRAAFPWASACLLVSACLRASVGRSAFP